MQNFWSRFINNFQPTNWERVLCYQEHEGFIVCSWQRVSCQLLFNLHTKWKSNRKYWFKKNKKQQQKSKNNSKACRPRDSPASNYIVIQMSTARVTHVKINQWDQSWPQWQHRGVRVSAVRQPWWEQRPRLLRASSVFRHTTAIPRDTPGYSHHSPQSHDCRSPWITNAWTTNAYQRKYFPSDT